MSNEVAAEVPLAQMPEYQMVLRARAAADAFACVDGDTTRRIARAMAEAGAAKAEFHAEWIVRETGYGIASDKTVKNLGGSIDYHSYYAQMNFTDPEVDEARKIVRVPRAAGIVLGLVPVTNPVSTLHAKAQMAVLTRSAIILCPHPGAKAVSQDAADTIIHAAATAGAPKDLIQILDKPSVALVQALMQSPDIDVILATGGPAMVRAAYSSSNPALGVGPGNVPVFVDETVPLDDAAQDVVASKSFDNSLACTSEQVVFVEGKTRAAFEAALTSAGCHILRDLSEIERLRGHCYPNGKLNPAIIGKSPAHIAEGAGIVLPAGARLIVVPINRIDYKEEFSREKLFPVLGLMPVADFETGLNAAQAMITMGGAGHSAAIHSADPYRIAKWGSVLKVYRVTVRAPNSFGVGTGTVTNLNPTYTIGTGYFGRSSVGENVTPAHLVHWTQIAFCKDPAKDMAGIGPAITRVAHELAQGSSVVSAPSPQATPTQDDLRQVVREIVLEEIRSMLGK